MDKIYCDICGKEVSEEKYDAKKHNGYYWCGICTTDYKDNNAHTIKLSEVIGVKEK